jgi:3-ketosteroid 9alpha-monooxygenase subunit A
MTASTPGFYQQDYQHGWFQIAFRDELKEGLNPVRIGNRRLTVLRNADSIRIFDADCPHRGAHLGMGGIVCEDAIICPFHGYAISINQNKPARFRANEYEAMRFGDLIFVRLSRERDNGLGELLRDLASEYTLVPAFHLTARTEMEVVIENAFDRLHFASVHGVRTGAFSVKRDDREALRVRSDFLLPGISSIPYEAITISPGLVLVMLGGRSPYGAITGAIGVGDGRVDIRLSFAFPRSAYGEKPDSAQYHQLLAQSERGLQQDMQVWENLATGITPAWTDDDQPIRQFRLYCQEFL